MHPILVVGAGKIGSFIAFLLAHSDDYQVFLADIKPNNPDLKKLAGIPHFETVKLNAEEEASLTAFIREHHIEAVVSSLPYYHNVHIAHVAAETNIHYFDLTEDTKTTETIYAIAKNSKAAFVPQCGLAPGFIGLITHHLMKDFDSLDTVKMRVGALPQHISNALQYALTWSTDGLINEYGNLCQAIEGGKIVSVLPLEGLEEIKIDGIPYEAFNTSGGVGSLMETYKNKVKHLNYKTIRYPGHCEKIKFLMNDLHLNEQRDTLKKILEQAIPHLFQDVVLIYVSVNGQKEGEFVEENYVKKFHPQSMHRQSWSAIQLTTASSLCAVVDMVLKSANQYHGFIAQEAFEWDKFTANRFGEYFVK